MMLAYMLDSLVRVSRRVDWNHFCQHLEQLKLVAKPPLGDRPQIYWYSGWSPKEIRPSFPNKGPVSESKVPKEACCKKNYLSQFKKNPNVYMRDQGYKQLDESKAPMKPTFLTPLYPAGVTDVDLLAGPRKYTRIG